jgi:outer membrane protein TolC
MLATALLLASACSAAADLRLTDAVDQALAHNHNVAAKGHALSAAVWTHRQARAQLLPSIELNSAYTRLDDETVGRANAFGREITFFLPDSAGNLQPVTITVPQTVFRDGYETWVSAQMLLFHPGLWNNVSLAGTSRKAADWEMEATRQETVHGTMTAFVELLKIDTLLELQREHLEQAVENTALAQRLYDVGRYSEADILRWQVEEARHRGTLTEQMSVRRVAVLNLENVMGAPPRGTVQADTVLPGRLVEELNRFIGMDATQWDAFLTENLEILVQGDPRLRVLETTQRLADLEHRRSTTNFLPSIALSGSYGWQNNNTPGLDGDKVWSARASLNVPLFTSLSNYSEYQATKQRRKQAEEEIEEARRQLYVAAEVARTSVRGYAELLHLAVAARESARRNFEIMRNNYSLGRLSNLEWIDANLALQDAEQIHASSHYDLVRAITDYYQARGEVFSMLGE